MCYAPRPMPTTTAVSITCTLFSNAGNPPYEMNSISGTISYDNVTTADFSGWDAESIGTPQSSGAPLTLSIVDNSYSATNQTSIGNWALTFIPRPGTTQPSPFGNQNTISGSGATNTNGQFTLNLGSVKLKNGGNWDWMLMVQVVLPGGTIECFSSDPEMEVGT